ncbi:Crp/Fnr family transcriptional regulator [Vibrio sp. HN007]|uniref:Crp/Fnr family transcriptional regulator n=1 Tax=Vibrio iocasae TaxID=3098914 RepID=UPI0035D4A65A
MNKSKLLQEGLEHIRLHIKNEGYKEIRIRKGEYIVRQNQVLDFVYWASVAQYAIYHTARNGKTLSLGDYFSEDRFFGEVECFSDELCQFDIVATADTELVVISKEQLSELLIHDGKIAFWMNCNTSKLYQSSMDVAIERSLYPLKYNILKDILHRYTEVSMPLSHTYMYQEAQRFGCTERAYNRIIHELINDGLIEKERDENIINPTNIEAIKACLNSYYK